MICKLCGKSTNFNKHRRFNIYCSKQCANKDPSKIENTKTTCIQKYGGKNPWGSIKVKNKGKQTLLSNWGVDNFAKSSEYRKIMENNHSYIPLDKKTEFEIYKLQVLKETRKWYDTLFMKWDGTDYYTGQQLLINKKEYNHKLYRTIDHKISIFKGFNDNISPSKIGHINNLCITSRTNNSSKRHDKELP